MTAPTQAQIEAAKALHRYELEHGYITREWGPTNDDENVYMAMAQVALTAAAEAGPLKKRPVAWRVRDCADGWIIYDDERKAYDDAEQRGAQMQGLYCRDATAAEVKSAQGTPPKMDAISIAAAEAGEPRYKYTDLDLDNAVEATKITTIERCAQWLTEEAKALRSEVSGGDGSENEWIAATALERAAAAIRALKDQP